MDERRTDLDAVQASLDKSKQLASRFAPEVVALFLEDDVTDMLAELRLAREVVEAAWTWREAETVEEQIAAEAQLLAFLLAYDVYTQHLDLPAPKGPP